MKKTFFKLFFNIGLVRLEILLVFIHSVSNPSQLLVYILVNSLSEFAVHVVLEVIKGQGSGRVTGFPADERDANRWQCP